MKAKGHHAPQVDDQDDSCALYVPQNNIMVTDQNHYLVHSITGLLWFTEF